MQISDRIFSHFSRTRYLKNHIVFIRIVNTLQAQVVNLMETTLKPKGIDIVHFCHRHLRRPRPIVGKDIVRKGERIRAALIARERT